MSENERYIPRKMFSAIKYKALDYVCEEATRIKVTMNLLALPMPYHPGAGHLYPHAGTLSYVTYRTPWVRGNVISTCKLLVGGSVLQDLGRMVPMDEYLERLSVTAHHLNGEDVVPSSNPDSQENVDAFWLLEHTEINGNLCQESFSKSIVNEMCSRHHHEDLLLPEDIILVDNLTQFRRHSCMPTMKAKLSRLRTLPVSDPLLSSAGDKLSEDIIFRHYTPYEVPPNVDADNNNNSHACSDIKEEFGRLTTDESLLLPVELHTFTLEAEVFNHLKDICSAVSVSPEPDLEQSSVLDMLHKVSLSLTSLNGEISQFEVLRGATADCMMEEGQLDPQSSGHLLLPSDMELSVTLTPTPKSRLTPLWLSASQLPGESVSPVYRSYLVSDSDREEMELALWKAEKHQTNVLGFLLAEPCRLQEVAVRFQPLSEALSTLEVREERWFSIADGDRMDLGALIPTGVPEMRLTSSSADFIETMTSLRPQAEEDNVEDFTVLTSQQIEYILEVFEEDSEASLPVGEVQVMPILKNTSQTTTPSPMELSGTSISAVPTCISPDTRRPDSPCAEAASSPSGCSARAGTSVSAAAASETQRRGVRESSVSALTNSYPALDKTQTSTMEKRKSKDDSKQAQGGASAAPFTSGDGDHRAILPVSKGPTKKDADPLSTFMMLRSQQSASASELPQRSTNTPVPPAEPQTTPQPEQQRPALDVRTKYNRSGIVTGTATRVSPSSSQQDIEESRIVHVQAKGSQWHAYCELLAFAHPCLSRAKELGLSYRGDFSSLDPEQTRFLLKQQEKELCRTRGHDQEVLFSQVALIHVLVMVKDVLLKCDLDTAVEYLPRVAEACAGGQRVDQLVRRLQVLLYLSQRSQEPCPKTLELQEQLAAWLRNRTGQNTQGKVLVMTAVDSERVRSMLTDSLSQVTGAKVMALCPEEGKLKLNGARVINSMRGSVCVVVCSQHLAADFPWHCFSLVVEYHHSGHSPWASVCKEKRTSHLMLHTVLPSADETASWSLEENVPYVLLVTEGLLNCPLLLQTLESTYNMSVLERGHCPSLQLLGGTQHYAVITVDESTAILIQEQAELCQDRACERMVLRLTALSLQYRCCWLILHYRGSQGEGWSSQGFSNLALVYSSLVLFGMKTEDLDVKVLIASEVEDIARWISRICFHRLMASSDDPGTYLDRSWLTVIPSEEESSLSGFPCLSPLVSQLMLSRSPSLHWLLGASLCQLEELLPQVPRKVLKLFSDTTSLYRLTAADPPSPPQSQATPPPPFIQEQPATPPPPGSPSAWTASGAAPHDALLLHARQPEPFSSLQHATDAAFLPRSPGAEPSIITGGFRGPDSDAAYTQRVGGGGGVDLRGLSSSDAHHFQNWWSVSPWKEKVKGEARFTGWDGAAVGGVIERGAVRGGEEWMQRSPANQDLYTSTSTTSPPGNRPFNQDLYTTTTSSTPDSHAFNQDLYTSTTSPPDGRPFKELLDSPFRYSPPHPTYCHTGYAEQQQHPDSSLYDGLMSPRQTLPWGGGGGGGGGGDSHWWKSGSLYGGTGTARISPDYGTKCWMGQERKRSGEAADMASPVLTPSKRGKLSYERVPGRIDGQTRLRFF